MFQFRVLTNFSFFFCRFKISDRFWINRRLNRMLKIQGILLFHYSQANFPADTDPLFKKMENHEDSGAYCPPFDFALFYTLFIEH